MRYIIDNPDDYYNAIGDEKIQKCSIFLAGTIDMGNSDDWQTNTIKSLEKFSSRITVINPRRKDWDSSWIQSVENKEFSQQVLWENDSIYQSSIVFVNILGNSQSPITLYEIGLCIGKFPEKLIIYCPLEFYRSGNVHVIAEYYDIPIFTEYAEALIFLKQKIKKKLRWE